MLLTRRALPAVAALLLAGCSSTPAAPPAASPTPTASPTPSPTLAAATVVDDVARQGCRALIPTRADEGEASPDNPALGTVADLLGRSQHFGLRFDGQQLAAKLEEYRKATDQADKWQASANITRWAKQVDADCTANGAFKPS